MVKSVKGIFHRSLLSAILILVAIPLFSQLHFQGKVQDAETGLPVQHFSVLVGDSEFSFNKGSFEIELSQLDSPERVITFNAEGYLPVSIPVSARSLKEITVSLIPQNINIQEIVVKAFHSEKRLMDTPGAIGIITNRQLVREPSFTLAPCSKA